MTSTQDSAAHAATVPDVVLVPGLGLDGAAVILPGMGLRRPVDAIEGLAARLLSGLGPGPVLVLAQWLQTGPAAMTALWRRTAPDRIDERLRRVRVPVVVVRGSRDALCPRDWAAHPARSAPRGRLVELPGAAHMTPQTRPDDVAALIAGLLA